MGSEKSTTVLRRQVFAPDSKPVEKAVLGILWGIYFRHEFARRNSEVTAYSRALLDEFADLLSERAGFTFLHPSGNHFFTNELIESFRGLRPPRSTEWRTKLVRFLDEGGVIPFRDSGQPFFANPDELKPEERRHVWDALLAFECFAQLKLKLGGPVMFPAMYAGVYKVDMSDELPFLAPSSARQPFLVYYQVPQQLLNNYFTAFGGNIWESNPELRTSQDKKKSDFDIRRLRMRDFQFLLKADNLKRFPPARGMMEKAMVALYQERFPKHPPHHNITNKVRVVRAWQKKSKFCADHYREIL